MSFELIKHLTEIRERGESSRDGIIDAPACFDTQHQITQHQITICELYTMRDMVASLLTFSEEDSVRAIKEERTAAGYSQEENESVEAELRVSYQLLRSSIRGLKVRKYLDSNVAKITDEAMLKQIRELTA